ncbi:MAG: glycosyltransferase family 2 protein [Anaerolineaceae bacterium]|nr:glycosyltransferase family 2 protein [Anaerolineaceae bacterium]
MNNFLPFVSLILPIRNEAKHIRGCLESIAQQDFPHEQMEIIIADGLSTDNTKEVVETFKPSDIPLIWLDNPEKIVPTGLNLAIRQARGDVIIRVDGHTTLASDYVQQCVLALQCSGAENVGGRMNPVGKNTFGKAVALATSSPFGVGGARFHYSTQEEWVDTVYLGAWPKEVFQKVGLFDEELVRDQDDEFNYRLREAGGKILLIPRINSWYSVRSQPKDLWKQYLQYGFWKVRVFQKHPRQMRWSQFIPPIFVLAVLISLLIAILFSWGWKVPLALAGLYLLAALIATLLTAARKGWLEVCLLPFTFAILHVSYGSGFLWGLIKFRKRWGDKVGKVPVLDMD